MKKQFAIIAVVCILLTACGGQRSNPTAFPSRTPEPSSTEIENVAPTVTSTPFPPYQNKEVVLNYYIVGNQADWDGFFDPPSGNVVTKLVLYDDGQMLIAGLNETYKQKLLSATENKDLLSKLEALGFYSLESNQQHDATDNLYNFEGKYQEIEVFGGLRDCILVNIDKSRNLCVHESYTQFLVPEMKSILEYLDTYQPAGMTPYYPDRILLTIQIADSSVENPPAIPWDERFPPLEKDSRRYTSGTSNQVIYIDGNMAEKIYLFFGSADTKVVSENGKEYIIYLRVLLPHEKVKNPQP